MQCRYGPVVEQLPSDQEVVGSTPTFGLCFNVAVDGRQLLKVTTVLTNYISLIRA